MDHEAIGRARHRLAAAGEGRVEPAAVEATLERARAQVESLAETAAGLEATLPARVQASVETGLREQVRPVGKNLAELRGLTNQMVRRLERIETEALAERHARVDDLALLVELTASGWKSIDDRLTQLEQRLQSSGAVVYRIDERQAS